MDDRENPRQKTRRIVSQRLESLQRAGVEQLRKRPAAVPPVAAAGPPIREKPEPVAPLSLATPPAPSPAIIAGVKLSASSAPALSALQQPYPRELPDDVAGRQDLLAAMSAEVAACQLCRDLACSRKQTVFGVGHAKPRVAFFGEAPGADEDRLGEPFVGRAGQLLTKIIEACGWKRSDVYIMNVLKCRPPENRNPLPKEVENCRPFFERQFEILRPEYIVCVGTVPAQALLETAESVGKLRGRFHRYRDSTVLVTYHPSYLLRNPSAKKYVWDDMQMLLKEMGLPIPSTRRE
jgi:uracil-DNA glycosylase family 4